MNVNWVNDECSPLCSTMMYDLSCKIGKTLIDSWFMGFGWKPYGT